MISKKIKLGSVEFIVIDLTQPLSLDQEVYPGDPKPKRTVFSDIVETGWHHYIHELGDHNFQPHGDAPNHQNLDSINNGFEVFDISYAFNSACMIDLSNLPNAKTINNVKFITEITKENLKPFSSLLSKKGAVVIRSGYDRWTENNYPHSPDMLPYLTGEAAEYLASFANLKVVGIDSMTVDPHGSHTAHQLLKEKLIVESMVHLYTIPTESRSSFDLQTSPVRIVGATGGPVTAYAFIENK